MARIWITPEGNFHSTTREDTHLTMATTIATKHGLTPGKTVYDDVDNLLKHDFVRFSEGNVEGKLAAIRKHVDLVNRFHQTELARQGKSKEAYFDFIGSDGKRSGSGETTLGEIAFWGSDDWGDAYRAAAVEKRRMDESIARQRFRRPRRDAVRVRPYRRQQGRTKSL